MGNDVFALIFFLSLIWCRYGAAELAPGLPVLAGSSAPGLAAPPGRACPLGWLRCRGVPPFGWPRRRGALPLGWPRRRGALPLGWPHHRELCPWVGHSSRERAKYALLAPVHRRRPTSPTPTTSEPAAAASSPAPKQLREIFRRFNMDDDDSLTQLEMVVLVQ